MEMILTEEERELLGKTPLEDCDIDDVVDYFTLKKFIDEINSDDILSAMDASDIAEYATFNDYVLDHIDEDLLREHISIDASCLNEIDTSDLIDELEKRDYYCVETNMCEKAIVNELKMLCTTLQPHGIKTGEDMKKILCEVIDRIQPKAFISLL